MKRTGFAAVKLEVGEPVLRSCWECNSAHMHLKDVDSLHICFVCGRYWIHGQYLDEFEMDEELDVFLQKFCANGGEQ